MSTGPNSDRPNETNAQLSSTLATPRIPSGGCTQKVSEHIQAHAQPNYCRKKAAQLFEPHQGVNGLHAATRRTNRPHLNWSPPTMAPKTMLFHTRSRPSGCCHAQSGRKRNRCGYCYQRGVVSCVSPHDWHRRGCVLPIYDAKHKRVDYLNAAGKRRATPPLTGSVNAAITIFLCGGSCQPR